MSEPILIDPYEKQAWVDDSPQHAVNASRMNHIEQGIEDANANAYQAVFHSILNRGSTYRFVTPASTWTIEYTGNVLQPDPELWVPPKTVTVWVGGEVVDTDVHIDEDFQNITITFATPQSGYVTFI